MANHRTLKKQIRAILAQLMDECLICNYLLPKFDDKALNSFATRIINMNKEYIGRINNAEETNNKKRTKQYYKTLIQDFNNETTELIEDMNKLSDENKKD